MKKNRPTKKNSGFKSFCYFCIFILVLLVLLKYTNARVMPSVEKTMEMYSVNKSVAAIDGAVKTVIERSNIASQDLYIRTAAENGRIMTFSANTVLINGLCSDITEEILSQMEKMSMETVYLPLGIITGFDFLAAKGPPVLEVSVKPLGNCVVDYKTSFKSEGINQVNYQIWLEIKTTVQAVNPVMSKSFVVEKNMPVVNTYIGGDVPESMFYPFKTE